MGRTNATFRHLLQGIRERWRGYRRALRARDQPHYDRLFEHADAHADASGYRNPEDPMDAVLLSMLLEHEKRLAELEEGVATDREEGVATDREDRVAESDHKDDRDATERDAVEGDGPD